MWWRIRDVVLYDWQSASRKFENNLYQIHNLFFSAESIHLFLNLCQGWVYPYIFHSDFHKYFQTSGMVEQDDDVHC